MNFREQVHAEASALVQRLHTDKAESVRLAQQALRQALDAAVEAAEAAITAPIVLDGDIQALTEKIEAAACARVEAATGEVTRDLQRALDDAHAESARLTEELEAIRAELEQAEEEYHRAQAAAQQSALAPLDLLLEAMRRFAQASTVSDVLSVLVESLAQNLGRAALFSVQGTRLEGVRQVGFEFASDISKLVVPLGIDSVLSDAVSSARVQGLLGPGLTARTRALFGGSPGFALVVPVVIRGQALAVIYADDASGAANDAVRPEQQMKLAELLLCQAVPRLPALLRTAQAVHEHQAHIRQLLDRIEQGHEEDRNGGVPADEMRARLVRRLTAARVMATRAAAASAEAARLFDEQVLLLANERSGSPFGADLGAALAASISSSELPATAAARA